jgi:hypothetical protein
MAQNKKNEWNQFQKEKRLKINNNDLKVWIIFGLSEVNIGLPKTYRASHL